MKTLQIQEGKIKLIVPSPKVYKLDHKMPVFYNPIMKLNRDISVLICKILKPKNALDLLAASGVRGLRLRKEADIKEVFINDANPQAAKLIKKNAALNKLKVKIFNLRAHEFLATKYKLKSSRFDYIDIDPFGTPVPFLDAAIKALEERGGILGVTATDTAALCGSAPAACLRKYGAKPLRNELMHEIGIRILLKKIIETGAQYDIALTPIYCHSTEHYMRVYLQAKKGAKEADEILKKVGLFKGAGPMWLGQLWDKKLAAKMAEISSEPLVQTIAGEAQIDSVGFIDLHKEAKKKGTGKILKMQDYLTDLEKKGKKAARTHFSLTGIRL